MPSFSPLKTIKRVSKSNLSQDNLTDLNSFSIDAAISAASTTPKHDAALLPSHQSFVTNTSFATANDTQQYESTTPAASYFVDSSDDENTNFGNNDPLTRLSRAANNVEVEFAVFLNTPSKSKTPTEISFKNPEETTPTTNMASKKSRAAPVVATRVPNPPAKAVVAAAASSSSSTKPAPQDA
jgi:hypothetical protein